MPDCLSLGAGHDILTGCLRRGTSVKVRLAIGIFPFLE